MVTDKLIIQKNCFVLNSHATNNNEGIFMLFKKKEDGRGSEVQERNISWAAFHSTR